VSKERIGHQVTGSTWTSIARAEESMSAEHWLMAGSHLNWRRATLAGHHRRRPPRRRARRGKAHLHLVTRASMPSCSSPEDKDAALGGRRQWRRSDAADCTSVPWSLQPRRTTRRQESWSTGGPARGRPLRPGSNRQQARGSTAVGTLVGQRDPLAGRPSFVAEAFCVSTGRRPVTSPAPRPAAHPCSSTVRIPVSRSGRASSGGG